MGMKVGEVFLALGFEVDDPKLDEFSDKIDSLEKNLAGIVAGATAAIFGINEFVQSSVKAAAAMFDFNQQTGDSIDTLQKWQAVTQLTDINMSAQDATASLMALRKAIASAQLNGDHTGAFSNLGIEPHGSLDHILDQLSERAKHFRRDQFMLQMQSLGLAPGMINALLTTKEQREKMAAPFIISDNAQARLLALGRELTELRLKWEKFKNDKVAEWSPELIAGAENLFTALQNIERGAEKVYQWWHKLTPAGKELAEVMGVVALAMFTWLNPIVGGSASLLFILYQVGGYLNGQKDLLADLLDTYSEMFEWISWIGKEIWDWVKAIEAFIEKLSLVRALKDLLSGKSDDDVYGPQQKKMQTSGSEIPSQMNDPDQGFFSVMKDTFQSLNDSIDLLVQGLNYANAFAPGGITGLPQLSQTNTIHVTTTSNSPEDIGAAVGRSIQTVNNRTFMQTNNGAVR